MGPAKELVNFEGDNEWLVFLMHYGVVGMVALAVLGWSFYRAVSDAAKAAAFAEVRALNFALKAFLLIAPAFMFVAGIYQNQQIMSVFLILLAWGTRQNTAAAARPSS